MITEENVGALNVHIDGMVGKWGLYNWVEIEEVISILCLIFM